MEESVNIRYRDIMRFMTCVETDAFDDLIQNIDILQEECAEVIQIASKLKRFGPDSYNPYDPERTSNLELLTQELGDVLAMIDIIVSSTPITWSSINSAADKKQLKLRNFYIKKEIK